jgi:hypothetical protein
MCHCPDRLTQKLFLALHAKIFDSCNGRLTHNRQIRSLHELTAVFDGATDLKPLSHANER